MRFSVDFLGCKVSHVDAHEIRERLLAGGHVEAASRADVAVINGCCVTNEALAKSRKAAARAARTHSRVYLTGCAANLATDALAGLPENVTVVAKRPEETATLIAGDVGAIGCVQSEVRVGRVRAFVKIQDGCSFSCGFCVIPLVRGSSRSRSAAAVLGEIRRRVDQGHREVVLTGINLGCFRDREAGFDLPRLVREAGFRGSRGCGSPLSRSTTSTRRSSPRCARRRRSRATSTSRCSRETTAYCARCAAATRPRRISAVSSRSPGSST
jgi:tRNA A37 methylthiotransferase MiaB